MARRTLRETHGLSEKMEMIRLVEGTDLPVRVTLRQLGAVGRQGWSPAEATRVLPARRAV